MQTRDNAARGAAKNRVRTDHEDTADVYPCLFASRRHSGVDTDARICKYADADASRPATSADVNKPRREGDYLSNNIRRESTRT
jgi:hypothetical protein